MSPEIIKDKRGSYIFPYMFIDEWGVSHLLGNTEAEWFFIKPLAQAMGTTPEALSSYLERGEIIEFTRKLDNSSHPE